MKTIQTTPLTADEFAPFGDVLSAADAKSEPVPANGGSAQMFGRLSNVQNLRPGSATQNWKLYRCTKNSDSPIPINELEKHPLSSQLFAPMGNAGRYVVAVATGSDAPDLSTLRAFVASNEQAIIYHPDIWHLPMTVLDRDSGMLSLVYEDGSEEDCVIKTQNGLFIRVF